MKAVKLHGVKRVVVTSSVAAIFVPEGWTRNMTSFDTSMWSDLGIEDGYSNSKNLAEKAAWKFAEENNIELATILPGFVFGPTFI